MSRGQGLSGRGARARALGQRLQGWEAGPQGGAGLWQEGGRGQPVVNLLRVSREPAWGLGKRGRPGE